jgi:hypothetical protein
MRWMQHRVKALVGILTASRQALLLEARERGGKKGGGRAAVSRGLGTGTRLPAIPPSPPPLHAALCMRQEPIGSEDMQLNMATPTY